MRYLDEAAGEVQHPKDRPRFCPLCRGKTVTRWRFSIVRRAAVALPYFMCADPDCGVGIQLRVTKRKLFDTRAAAIKGAQPEVARRQREWDSYDPRWPAPAPAVITAEPIPARPTRKRRRRAAPGV